MIGVAKTDATAYRKVSYHKIYMVIDESSNGNVIITRDHALYIYSYLGMQQYEFEITN